MKKNNKGFTLIELIVVLVIVGILAAIAVPQYLGFAEKARAAEAINMLGAMKTAEEAYAFSNSSAMFYSSAPFLTSGSAAAKALGISVPSGSSMWRYVITTDYAGVSGSCLICAIRSGTSSWAGRWIGLCATGSGASVTWTWVGDHPGKPQ